MLRSYFNCSSPTCSSPTYSEVDHPRSGRPEEADLLKVDNSSRPEAADHPAQLMVMVIRLSSTLINSRLINHGRPEEANIIKVDNPSRPEAANHVPLMVIRLSRTRINSQMHHGQRILVNGPLRMFTRFSRRLISHGREADLFKVDHHRPEKAVRVGVLQRPAAGSIVARVGVLLVQLTGIGRLKEAKIIGEIMAGVAVPQGAGSVGLVITIDPRVPTLDAITRVNTLDAMYNNGTAEVFNGGCTETESTAVTLRR